MVRHMVYWMTINNLLYKYIQYYYFRGVILKCNCPVFRRPERNTISEFLDAASNSRKTAVFSYYKFVGGFSWGPRVIVYALIYTRVWLTGHTKNELDSRSSVFREITEWFVSLVCLEVILRTAGFITTFTNHVYYRAKNSQRREFIFRWQ